MRNPAAPGSRNDPAAFLHLKSIRQTVCEDLESRQAVVLKKKQRFVTDASLCRTLGVTVWQPLFDERTLRVPSLP